ncbi:MAG: 50S ribosomal protein L22 [Candidatus Aenigmarchaeota archaeon]|nr:50S ribosomal protein L22 [Candidatus Aenigmarchaeota archaeon]
MYLRNNIMASGYAVETDPKTTSRVLGRNLSISKKYSVEVGRTIKGMKLKDARKKMQNAIELKEPIHFVKYNRSTGHRKGGVIGKYPKNVCLAVDNLLDTLEKNAIDKGLDDKKLYIKYVFVSKAFRFPRRRKVNLRGQRRKNTNVGIVCEEVYQ